MADVAADLLKTVGQMVFDQIVGDIRKDFESKGLIEKAVSDVERILASQQSVAKDIVSAVNSAVQNSSIGSEVQAIRNWQTQLCTASRIKDPNVKEDAMKTLTTSLRDPSRGIQCIIQNIDSLLRGQHRPDETTRGWISLVIQRYYTKLADEGNMEYTVNSFLRDIAIFLKYYFVLQAGACSLALHVAYDSNQKDATLRQVENNINAQVAYAFDLLPPFLRRMKKGDMHTPINMWYFWRFEQFDRLGKWLTHEWESHWLGPPTSTITIGGGGAAPEREWRFSAALDTTGLVKIKSRKRNRWIKGQWVGGGYTYGTAFNPSVALPDYWRTAMGEDGNEHKIIPLMDDLDGSHSKYGEIGDRPAFKIVPNDARGRDKEPYNKVWVLVDDGVGQPPQFADSYD